MPKATVIDIVAARAAAKTAAARAALNTYVANVEGERGNSRDTQAVDLITDLLLMFEPDMARQILETADLQVEAERDDVTPVYVGI